jgi:hypothetical protein
MSARLSKEKFEYLEKALTNLGERVRAEGETSLLDLPTILAEIRRISPRPKSDYELEAKAQFEEQRHAREEANAKR